MISVIETEKEDHKTTTYSGNTCNFLVMGMNDIQYHKIRRLQSDALVKIDLNVITTWIKSWFDKVGKVE
jgi:hypothetical protein